MEYTNPNMNPSFQEHLYYYYGQQEYDDTQTLTRTNPGDAASRTRKKTKTTTSKQKLSTDPQSVAARERRHRISHRLKTLQSMVPGAAKMDTVSLLDHAIHYVHFLNSQIRLHHFLLMPADPLLLLPPPFGPLDAAPALPWPDLAGSFQHNPSYCSAASPSTLNF